MNHREQRADAAVTDERLAARDAASMLGWEEPLMPLLHINTNARRGALPWSPVQRGLLFRRPVALTTYGFVVREFMNSHLME